MEDASIEEFCNFRALTGGNLKEDFLFRGTSPVDNSRGRASYTDKFVCFLHGTENAEELMRADYVPDAKRYLMEGGMSETEVEQLLELITK